MPHVDLSDDEAAAIENDRYAFSERIRTLRRAIFAKTQAGPRAVATARVFEPLSKGGAGDGDSSAVHAVSRRWGRRMIVLLRFAAAVFAFFAGAFWLMSAWGELPQMIAYWDYTPADDPFFRALAYSARMNRLAAWSACISAFLAGTSEMASAWLTGRDQ
jgi:hypothetical protein